MSGQPAPGRSSGGRYFASVLLMVCGTLIMLGAGGCGILGFVVMGDLGSGRVSMNDVAMVLLLSGVPFAIGIGLIWLGRRIDPPAPRDASPPDS